MIDFGWWSLILEGFVELLLDFIVGVEDLNTKLSVLLADLQGQAQQSLEVGDVKTELQSFLAKTDPPLQSLIDVLVEIVALVVGVNVM